MRCGIDVHIPVAAYDVVLVVARVHGGHDPTLGRLVHAHLGDVVDLRLVLLHDPETAAHAVHAAAGPWEVDLVQ